jgi:hypothetical protein
VPNKIIKRLFGKSCYSSVHLKPHAMKGKKNKTCGQTTEYLQTLEHIELKEKRAGERWVNYKEYGWFILRALARRKPWHRTQTTVEDVVWQFGPLRGDMFNNSQNCAGARSSHVTVVDWCVVCQACMI